MCNICISNDNRVVCYADRFILKSQILIILWIPSSHLHQCCFYLSYVKRALGSWTVNVASWVCGKMTRPWGRQRCPQWRGQPEQHPVLQTPHYHCPSVHCSGLYRNTRDSTLLPKLLVFWHSSVNESHWWGRLTLFLSSKSWKKEQLWVNIRVHLCFLK